MAETRADRGGGRRQPKFRKIETIPSRAAGHGGDPAESESESGGDAVNTNGPHGEENTKPDGVVNGGVNGAVPVANGAPSAPDTSPLAKHRQPGPTMDSSSAPQPQLTGEDTDPFLFMGRITTDEWKLTTVYLYRIKPITNRKGDTVNIGVYGSMFDQKDVLNEHGSGEYRVDIVRDKPHGGGRVRLRQLYFNVMNPKFPPKIPAGEWVDDPRNKEWEWARNTPQAQGLPLAAGIPQGLDSALLKTVFDFVEKKASTKEDQSELTAKMLDQLSKNQERMISLADPTKQLAVLESIFKVIAPQNRGGDDPLIQMLMEDRKAARAENAELRKLIMDRPAPKDFFETVQERMPILERLFGGGGGKADWRTMLAEGLTEVAKSAAPVAIALAGRIMSPAGAQQHPGGPGPGPIPRFPLPSPVNAPSGSAPASSTTIPMSAEPAAYAPPAAAHNNPSSSAEGQVLNPVLLAKYQGVIESSLTFMIDQYRAGDDGYFFRDWFIKRKGIDWWAGLKREVGTAGLVMVAKLDANIWANLQPEDKLTAWLDQFFTDQGAEPEGYFDDDEELPEDMAASPQAAAPQRAKSSWED